MNELDTYTSAVNSFYLAFFGRPADPEGLAFWAGHLADNGGDYRFITEAFAGSEEAQVRFGTDTPAERIAEIYQQLFNRAPEQAGLDYWTDVVEQGHASLADVAVAILGGAQGTDLGLAELRQQAASDFTAQVAEAGSDYTGYAAVEAARVLVRAVTSGASQEDVAQLVQATVAFADIASNNPAVIDAIATGSTLLALFDTPRGLLDPVTLAQALADVAKAAAGNPATLESLLRGGGMSKVLEVMPAAATLRDVVDALADGGLPAAIDVVYPPRPVTPSAPVSSLAFDSVEQGTGDRDPGDHVTSVEKADIKFTYSGAVKSGQSFQYSIDGGEHWISTGIDTSARGVVVLQDVDLTLGAPDLPPPPPRMAIMEADPVDDLLTTVELRLVDASKNEVVSASGKIVLDRFAEILDVELINAGAKYFPGLSAGRTNVAGFEIDGLEEGAVVQYRYLAPGANMAVWTDKMPELQDGMHTVEVRQVDRAGNASDAREMSFFLQRGQMSTPTLQLANDTGSDAHDGVTSDGTVVIENLATTVDSAWEYTIDDGKTWTLGAINKDTGKAELELSTLAQASGTLLVRQIDAGGNTSVASNRLDFTFDDVKPTETLSFRRIEGEDDGVLTTGQSKVDVTFGVAHKDDGMVQWRLKGSAEWIDVDAYNDNGSFTLENIDLTDADQVIELQVVDAAGNVGFSDSFAIDGPAGVSVKATIAGLEITSSVAGAITLSGDPLLSNQIGGGAIVGTVLVGAQGGYRSGTVQITPDQGPSITDDSGILYQLGRNTEDNMGGTHMWGFAGDDKLGGSIGDDFISGGEGDDIIVSGGGSDFISGGMGADKIVLVADGKFSTLHYDEKETAFGRFTDGKSIAGMDQILGAESGDVIQVGDIFEFGPGTVSDSYLVGDDSGHVAVIRGTLANAAFTANAEGSSYMVQWTDAVGINSVVVNSYGGVLGLEVDRDKGTLTLAHAPVVSTYSGVTYRFSATDSAFHLDGAPDGIIHSGSGNGLLAGADFSLTEFITGTTDAAGYLSGPDFGIGSDGYMHFGSPLEAGVYAMSFNARTFATASGSFAGGEHLFAGGVAGKIVQDGIDLDRLETIHGYYDDANNDVGVAYSVIGTGNQLITGMAQDVVVASETSIDLLYGRIDSSAQDLLFGFGGDDLLMFTDAAETAIDKNQNGVIDWARLRPLEANDEGIVIDIDGALATGELGNDASATLATLRKLDVQVLAKHELLILARDADAGSAMLLHYSDADGNGIINGGEVEVVATFVNGIPVEDEIVVIGSYQQEP